LNISYLNSPSPPLSFILPPLSDSWNSFNRYHLHTCVHIFCTLFTLLHLVPATSNFPLMPVLPLSRTCSVLMISDFIE
jgi:hypothetical protein